jgi:hypothetical protein
MAYIGVPLRGLLFGEEVSRRPLPSPEDHPATALLSRLHFYFQQDGVPPHFRCTVRQCLDNGFVFMMGRFKTFYGTSTTFLRHGTNGIFFLVRHFKSLVYDNWSRGTAALQGNIHTACIDLTSAILRCML